MIDWALGKIYNLKRLLPGDPFPKFFWNEPVSANLSGDYERLFTALEAGGFLTVRFCPWSELDVTYKQEFIAAVDSALKVPQPPNKEKI